METVKSSCCKHKIITPKKVSASNGTLSFFSTLLLILLPKCPLCLTAYMGAILLFFDIDNALLAPFLLHSKPVLGIVILLMILFNNKGRKTLIAASMAVFALILLILSSYYYIEILPNGVLYAVFIFAIWYNGNFQYFYRFIRFRNT